MPKVELWTVLVFLLCLRCPPAGAQGRLIYRERTVQQVVRVEVWEEKLSRGAILFSVMSSGEVHKIVTDETGAVVSYDFAFPPAKTAYTATRKGNVIRIEGVLKGRPISRDYGVDERPWYESMERSLQQYAISGASESIHFWIVHPYEAWVFLLEGRREKLQEVEVNDRSVEAIRLRVRPTGFFALLWKTVFWYRPTDGTFLRSESARGLPGTPMTILELVEEDRLGG